MRKVFDKRKQTTHDWIYCSANFSLINLLIGKSLKEGYFHILKNPQVDPLAIISICSTDSSMDIRAHTKNAIIEVFSQCLFTL